MSTLGAIGTAIAVEAVRAAFAAIDNEEDAKGRIMARATQLLPQLNLEPVPDAGAGWDAALAAKERELAGSDPDNAQDPDD